MSIVPFAPQPCFYCHKPTAMRAFESDIEKDDPSGKKVLVPHVWPPCCLGCTQDPEVEWDPIPSSECPVDLLELARLQPKHVNPFLSQQDGYDAGPGGDGMVNGQDKLNAQNIITLMVNRYQQKISQVLLLNTGHLAELLGVSEATVKRWADAGRIPSNRTVGHHRKFRPEDVATFLNAEPKILERLLKDMLANAPPAPSSADVAPGEASAVVDGSQALTPVVEEPTGAPEPLQANADGRVLLDPRNVLVRMPDGSVQSPVVADDGRVVVMLNGCDYELFSAEVG